ncbi:RnaseH domain, transposon factor [Schizophyllum commune]
MLASQFATNFARDHPQIRHIHFFADKTSAIGTIFDPRPHAGQRYSRVFYERICKALDNDEQLEVEIEWCPGHKDIVGNERADALVKRAAEEHSTETCSGTRWRREWDHRPTTGRYAVANRIPPSLKPLAHFRDLCGDREQYGRYYKDFVPSESVDCPCGESIQTRPHVLQDCPIYEPHRHILRGVSEDVAPAEILGTPKGIDALARFLKKSGAFTKTGHPRAGPRTPRWEDEPGSANDGCNQPGDYDTHADRRGEWTLRSIKRRCPPVG